MFNLVGIMWAFNVYGHDGICVPWPSGAAWDEKLARKADHKMDGNCILDISLYFELAFVIVDHRPRAQMGAMSR
jgi:hypothetical protein